MKKWDKSSMAAGKGAKVDKSKMEKGPKGKMVKETPAMMKKEGKKPMKGGKK